jgi:acyl-CoA thioesterase-1
MSAKTKVALVPLALCLCLSTNVAAQQPAPPTAEEVAKRQLAQEERFHNDWPNLQRYRDANAKLSPPVKKENRVVILGNSNTE